MHSTDGWNPKTSWRMEIFVASGIGHMGTTMVECIAWEKGWDKAYACDV